LLFSTVAYSQKKMLEEVKQVSKEVLMVGRSASGEITGKRPISNYATIMALDSDTVDFTIGVGGHKQGLFYGSTQTLGSKNWRGNCRRAGCFGKRRAYLVSIPMEKKCLWRDRRDQMFFCLSQ